MPYKLRIKHLEEAHHILNKEIDALERTGKFKDEQLNDMKKRKLFLKDEISRLKKLQFEEETQRVDFDDER